MYNTQNSIKYNWTDDFPIWSFCFLDHVTDRTQSDQVWSIFSSVGDQVGNVHFELGCLKQQTVVWDWSESYKVTFICARLYSFLRKFETGELQIPLVQMDDFQSKKLKCHLTFSGCYSAAVTSINRGLFFFRDSQ